MSGAPPSLRELLGRERFGVLATISARREGWPFASIVGFAPSGSGEVLLLLSELAEHTRNLRVEPKASLIVSDSDSAQDPQASARVTFLGTAHAVDSDSADRDKRTYIEKHPEAGAYAAMADFHLWVVRLTEARFVNGFGDMGWLSADRLHAALAE